MTEKIESTEQIDEGKRRSRYVRLPGFIDDDDIGLGDVIKRATSYLGIPACGGAIDGDDVLPGRRRGRLYRRGPRRHCSGAAA